MRIVFDCRSIHPQVGGIGRTVLRELPRALAGHELIVLRGRDWHEDSAAAAEIGGRTVTVDAAMVDPRFEQLRLPGLLSEINPCYAVPVGVRDVRRIATVHDVAFRSRPDLVDPSIGTYLDHWTKVSCLVADAVVTVSEFSRGEILRFYPIENDRLEVVANGVDATYFDLSRPTAAAPHATAPYILYVGCIEEKKNVAALVQGFAELLRRRPELPHRLVLTGGTAGGLELEIAELAGEPQIKSRVEQTGYVSEARLRSLYAGAASFCYLSEYEGFGLPPLEAMAAGIPTLVSDRALLPEVTAGAALLVDPHDRGAVADALDRLLSDDSLRRSLSRRGRTVAARYSWAESAKHLAVIYQRAMGREPRAYAAASLPQPPPDAW
jgi:glycosyltransferase involved in cell wall biosynthesis